MFRREADRMGCCLYDVIGSESGARTLGRIARGSSWRRGGAIVGEFGGWRGLVAGASNVCCRGQSCVCGVGGDGGEAGSGVVRRGWGELLEGGSNGQQQALGSHQNNGGRGQQLSGGVDVRGGRVW
ncbi:hypothetical protein T440DRAFT_200622 [Plenodomus tracheiphilus IPT5]|uniref:Uncharacterized protein n=1 Tax=Plenodomus tracheiphilus IPT5 TaxID=1408161 RepID=A0A6A7BHX0_9PLEO|nr:hypothetical protein T440DRAFT_200622 [Plenodomus tracheiphilus IPT5]